MMSAEKEACCVYMKDYSNVVVVFFCFFWSNVHQYFVHNNTKNVFFFSY